MAVSAGHTQGYPYEFIEPVPDDFYCNKCSLVARRLTFTSCCGESFCYVCIADIQQQVNPCPACGQCSFTTMEQLKYQRRMQCLKVYCSLKGRGCDWSGTLDQLDAHLDPDLDHCQHVDIHCPLSCQETIPRNKTEQHMAKECVKREFVCQHCAYQATYEEVVDTHLPKCIYFPMQCPNVCGVTCERDVMEDHMKMCRLEEVVCEFSGVGCDGKFRREKQEEHARQNTQKHLTMIAVSAAAAVEMNQQLRQKLQEQDVSYQTVKEEWGHTFQQLEEKLQEHKQKLQDQEQKLQEQEQKRQEQEETSRAGGEATRTGTETSRSYKLHLLKLNIYNGKLQQRESEGQV